MQAAALVACEPPVAATIQDAGRSGWMRWGVSGSGAMDLMALSTANGLVGNPRDEAAIEFAIAGGSWRIEARSCRLAVCGGSFAVFVDGDLRSSYASLTLRHGQLIAVSGAPDAMWGYIAVEGGFDLPRFFGSRSTHVRSGIGGRLVRAGDRIPLVLDAVEHAPSRAVAPPRQVTETELRVVMGPQDDHFEVQSLARFREAEWQVSHRIDRMGYHLAGPALVHSEKGANIVSDGIVAGSVQVPAIGQPIAMMMDRQTTGGYPKIATIVSADLGRLAQQRPGRSVRFRAVPVEEAVRLKRAYAAELAEAHRCAGLTRPFMARHAAMAEVVEKS